MCANHKRPGLLKSVVNNKCPRCRQGNLFIYRNPYALKTTMRMPDHCSVCGQHYELQTGFYFGTGFVSYALSVMVLGIVFVSWALTLGLSYKDNSIIWCLATSIVLLVLLQPPMQRLARSIWIAFFVRYDPAWQRVVHADDAVPKSSAAN